jgi:hypothetical protein
MNSVGALFGIERALETLRPTIERLFSTALFKSLLMNQGMGITLTFSLFVF